MYDEIRLSRETVAILAIALDHYITEHRTDIDEHLFDEGEELDDAWAKLDHLYKIADQLNEELYES